MLGGVWGGGGLRGGRLVSEASLEVGGMVTVYWRVMWIACAGKVDEISVIEFVQLGGSVCMCG